ncbi:pilus assembly protein CpaB [Pararobbsia alpina]|uniref:Flp pilus assembly protein CpaB n=1 Tax=Pararobbsia alpina TaxID=621374 RepID=UPI0039A5678E
MMLKRIKTQTLINNPWVLLGMAVIAATILTWWMFRYMSGREAAMRESLLESMNAHNQVSVLVPVNDLKPGVPISSENFAAREVPADFVYEDTVRAEEFDSLSNLTLVRPVKRGAPIRRADISAFQARDFSDMLKTGTRALTIDIDTTNSADNMLKPGNHIDLFLIAEPADGDNKSSQNEGQSAHLLLSDLNVLATGQDIRPRDYGENVAQQDDGQQRRGYDSVTLEVTPDQAGRIALAQKVGTLRAVLRNRADKAATPPVDVVQASLFGDTDAGGIQYIVGGSGNSSVSTRPELDLHLNKPVTASAAPAPTTAQRMAALTDAQQRAMQQIQNAVNGHMH